jgi:hypothetical protein
MAARSANGASKEARWRHAVYDSIFERRRFDFTPQLSRLALELIGTTVPEDEAEFELVSESTREAMLLGVNGVPAFVLDDLLFGGIQDGEAMVRSLSELAQLHREAGQSAVN